MKTSPPRPQPAEPPVPEAMDPIDIAWLHLDSEVNLMMIVGVWIVRPGVTLATLRERVADRMLKYPRFRQRVLQGAIGTYWEDDPEFDIHHHLVAEKLHRKPGQSAREALQARIGVLCAEPLDPARPLWQFHLVEHFEGGSVMVCRVHHCIGDGMAMSAVTMSLADDGLVPTPHAGTRHHPRHFDHVGLAEQAADWLKKSGHAVSDALSLALMPNDSPTRLKGPANGRKHVAWCAPLPLAAVKAAGHALGCSVNDVLVGCVSGAIGQYLRNKGDDPSGKTIRAMVPVNLRPHDAPHGELGNRFGTVPLMLPIGIENTIERIFAVRKTMGELKGSLQPVMTFGAMAAAGLVNQAVEAIGTAVFSSKTTAVVTNVKGPEQLIRLCGSELREIVFWVPTAGEVGLGVSVMSYHGQVQFGLRTDDALCREPHKIIDLFVQELERLTQPYAAA